MLTVVKHSSMQRFKWKCDDDISLVIALPSTECIKKKNVTFVLPFLCLAAGFPG